MPERSQQNVDELIHSFLHFDKAASTAALHHIDGLSRTIQEEQKGLLSEDARDSLRTLKSIAQLMHAKAELRQKGFAKLLYAAIDSSKVDREEIEQIVEEYEAEHANILSTSGLISASRQS
ncbi:MAG: hypothetical protein C9356_00800 [Oleiphilus sp.]|nr:MAG: hypothetical protein C9356_00800 [Oleiphilus sp.]